MYIRDDILLTLIANNVTVKCSISFIAMTNYNKLNEKILREFQSIVLKKA